MSPRMHARRLARGALLQPPAQHCHLRFQIIDAQCLTCYEPVAFLDRVTHVVVPRRAATSTPPPTGFFVVGAALLAPSREAPFDSFVSDQGRIKAGVTKYLHRRIPKKVPPHALVPKRVLIVDARRRDTRHGIEPFQILALRTREFPVCHICDCAGTARHPNGGKTPLFT